MKTDRELLEAAAKAAGIIGRWHADYGFNMRTDEWPNIWNPLTDDGDALRLAMHLGMRVSIRQAEADGGAILETDATPDYMAATRRAIVTAAAAIATGHVLVLPNVRAKPDTTAPQEQ